MKAEQVAQAPIQKFVVENRRLVFWHDPKSEITDYVTGDLLSEVTAVHGKLPENV